MMTATDHPFSPILNAGRKVVFSTTLKAAAWNNTTIASGDTVAEVDRLRQGGEGHIIVWGGVSVWRSLMRLDLIDEFWFDLYPYITSKGTQLFEDVPPAYTLELISSEARPSGMLDLRYRRRR